MMYELPLDNILHPISHSCMWIVQICAQTINISCTVINKTPCLYNIPCTTINIIYDKPNSIYPYLYTDHRTHYIICTYMYYTAYLLYII